MRPEATVDLAQLARHVADTLAPLAREMGVEIKLDADQPVIVTGDRDELVRVAENLIENAIKYGARQDGVERRPGRDRGRAHGGDEGVLIVRDFGRGIAPEHLPRLTERFYRVDPGQSRAKNGTGLGLAIVKHILTRHRGRLTIVSRLGAWLDLQRLRSAPEQRIIRFHIRALRRHRTVFAASYKDVERGLYLRPSDRPAVQRGPTEFRLLEYLLERPGRVFSRAQLLDGVWGQAVEIDERTVDVHVGRLRKALSRGRERDPIRTVRGAGYSFDETYGKV